MKRTLESGPRLKKIVSSASKRKSPAIFALMLSLVLAPQFVRGETCVTQAQMNANDRENLESTARTMAELLVANDVAALAKEAMPEIANGLANSGIANLSRAAKDATVTVNSLTLLDATDAQPNQDVNQFFCSLSNSTIHAVYTLHQLEPAKYALAIVHASGVANPQQIAIILRQEASSWKLSGFSFKPLTMAGHDGLWYWAQARTYAKAKQLWPAYLYYSTAGYLLAPVPYVSSTNLEKLQQEQQAATPAGFPGAQPLRVDVNGNAVSITSMSTDASLGRLDLVVRYTATDVSDPVAARQHNIDVMKALLRLHPELAQAFAGLWVYAVAPNQQPYAIELPVTDIR